MVTQNGKLLFKSKETQIAQNLKVYAVSCSKNTCFASCPDLSLRVVYQTHHLYGPIFLTSLPGWPQDIFNHKLILKSIFPG